MTTLLEAVRSSLTQAGKYNATDVAAPAAILWTDSDSQWQPIVTQLRTPMPELLTLGAYQPEERIGPAIWLRCIVDRTLEPKLPDTAIPIIYLPGISRQMFRAADDCPDSLRPLIELQFRGTLWTQRNGKDWTIESFLISEDGGLELDVAKDQRTREAMLGALSRLAITPLSSLGGRRLEAEDFDKLMVDDAIRDILLWAGDPIGTRKAWSPEKWGAFRSRCQEEYGFDPETDGEIAAGERLGKHEQAWGAVWKRFAESPALYPGIPNLLRRAKPAVLTFDKEPWPDENEQQEAALQQDLRQLESLSPAPARQRILELDKEHGIRREWVWVRLGQAPLAQALEHLVVLARHTTTQTGGDSVETMADLYAREGYLADDAVLRALALVKSGEDQAAVVAAIRAIYLSWLDDTTSHFQRLFLKREPFEKAGTTDYVHQTGQCVLFCDALRYDLAQRLVRLAETRPLRVTLSRRWAALPTVTATAKPAVSPVRLQIAGSTPGETFTAEIKATNQGLTPDRFRKLLEGAGYQILASNEYGLPAEPNAMGWTEFGEFDKAGHSRQRKMVTQLDDDLQLLLERIVALIDSGWKQVRLVTDHGWLLMPGGLPVVQLPKYLTESRWSRCASIKPGSRVDLPLAYWHWNSSEQFAVAPGASCFVKGNEYAHGGISIQECLIPEIVFTPSSDAASTKISITNVQWSGMRCRVTVAPAAAGVSADLRTKAGDPASSVTDVREIDPEGRVGLLVADDSLLGTAVCLVLLDVSGRVIGKMTTTVGGEE